MTTVTSPDGTVVGYESVGAGPHLLLVHGSTGTRARWSVVTPTLAQRYSVHAMDRRGRGLSTAEAEPYSLAREAEDVAAVAEAVGGDVYVIGHSYGALAVLEAALITSAFRRIMLYEPPIPSPGLEVTSPEGMASEAAANEILRVSLTLRRWLSGCRRSRWLYGWCSACCRATRSSWIRTSSRNPSRWYLGIG
ncbi:putative hydrolase or acyltransferase of alpha/beta superfamily [Natronococcus occultus SP4] [Mycobacterium shimoidei]|uniref:Putative hydrolase or acyltransferase of alpha/beta superfamily [Natronococcus occultus SP4] n=1 Tax=Mycobacterium shimoidei TaxID=29313 RepID=A0A375Z4R4_MYCSH|nr:alpha/beta hydrolase [Mycobacterium shimoidei]SRX96138.1 putative hydrolase or acyltransferase of alpha/beta superfamily [Natronococcus occultus SP4] [Mycobacterium shimoidei]